MQETAIIELRNLQIEDYLDLKTPILKAYPDWENSYWKEYHIRRLLDTLSERMFTN